MTFETWFLMGCPEGYMKKTFGNDHDSNYTGLYSTDRMKYDARRHDRLAKEIYYLPYEHYRNWTIVHRKEESKLSSRRIGAAMYI